MGSSTRSLRLVTGAAAVALALVVVGVYLSSADRPGSRGTEHRTQKPSTSMPTSSDADDDRLVGIPDSAIVADEHQNVVLIDTATGATIRTLYAAPSEPAGYVEVAVQPDRKTIYATMPTAESCGDVKRIDVLTGASSSLGVTGMALSVTPDGRHLLYHAPERHAGRCLPGTLIVRDLQTGAERRVPRRPGTDSSGIFSITVSPDSRRAAFVYGGEEGTNDVVAVDLESPRLSTEVLSSPVADERWLNPVFAPYGLTVLAVCCGQGPSVDSSSAAPDRLLLVDAGRRLVLREFPDDVRGYDLDGSGRHVVWVNEAGDVQVGDRSGGLRTLRSGAVQAFW